MKCKQCGNKHQFRKNCLDEAFVSWIVNVAEKDFDANWCLMTRHFLDEMREAGFDIIKKEPVPVRGREKK
jgi:hypothetical protein